MEEYGNLVFSICYKMTQNYFDAQDLMQETFLSAFRSLSSFDGANPKAWLSRIATNKCLDYLKQAARRIRPAEDTLFLSLENGEPATEDTILEKEVKQRLYELCRQLKPPYDEIAVSYFCLEKTAEELARERNKNPKTIRTQIYRARDMLKKLWRKEPGYGKPSRYAGKTE